MVVEDWSWDGDGIGIDSSAASCPSANETSDHSGVCT
jgi:hypothetical protein